MSAAVDDDLWSAVGDPTRRRMLDLLLADGNGTATSLSQQLPVTRQAIAKHLGVLDRVGLVHATPAGRERRYRVDEAQLARAVAQLSSALTTAEGLAGWWTTNTQGEGNDLGGVLQFRFGAGGFDMKVLELDPGKRVLCEVVDGPEEWIGTHVDWDLDQVDDHTIVLFKHEGWKEPVEFMHHCSTKWAVFLMSLKSLIETGKGAPDPHDVKIDNWN